MNEQILTAVPVFDYGRLIGHISEPKPSLFEAIDRRGSLGLYNGWQAAAHAVLLAARSNMGARI